MVPNQPPRTKSIRLLQNQKNRAIKLLANRPLEIATYNAWRNTTKEILSRIFGTDSEIVSNIVPINNPFAVPEGASEDWLEKSVVERLHEQLILLESPIQLLEMEIDLEKQNESKTDSEADNPNNGQEINLQRLTKLIIQHFDQTDLRQLCFNINVPFDDLGESIRHSVKSQSLVDYVQRRGRTLELLIQVVKERPKANWETILE